MSSTRRLRGAPGAAVRILLACACALAATLVLVPAADAAARVATPRGLRATAATATTLSLRWAAPRRAHAYRVQYSTSYSMRGAKYLRTTRATGTLRGLRSSTRYYFRVRVVSPRTGRALSGFTGRPSARTATPPMPITWPSTTTAPGPSTGVADVNVASFNLFGVNNDAKAAGEMRPWRVRRPVVVDQILGENADVVGLQEANQSTIYGSSLDYGPTQYADLKGALNATGRHFALTNEASYNCVKANSATDCQPYYRGASNSSRILYDTDTLTLVTSGSMKYATQSTGHIDRYLAWGVFRIKATGGEFLFANTHLDSYDIPVRIAQWNELINRVNQLKNGRPVVVVGDFNTTKFMDWAEEMLPLMKAQGYGDVLDQRFQTSDAVAPRAQSLVNAWIGSSNRFDRDVRTFSYDAAQQTKIGNNIDWVFATNELVVKEWETVVDFDPDTLEVNGVLPSDHNMIRATLTIP